MGLAGHARRGKHRKLAVCRVTSESRATCIFRLLAYFSPKFKTTCNLGWDPQHSRKNIFWHTRSRENMLRLRLYIDLTRLSCQVVTKTKQLSMTVQGYVWEIGSAHACGVSQVRIWYLVCRKLLAVANKSLKQRLTRLLQHSRVVPKHRCHICCVKLSLKEICKSSL